MQWGIRGMGALFASLQSDQASGTAHRHVAIRVLVPDMPMLSVTTSSVTINIDKHTDTYTQA